MRKLLATLSATLMVWGAFAQSSRPYALQSQVLTQLFPEAMAFHGGWDIGVNTRQQWVGFEGRPEYYQLNSSGYIHKARTAVGLSYGYNRQRYRHEQTLVLSASPRLNVSEKLVLTPSASFTYGNIALRVSDYFIDPTLPNDLNFYFSKYRVGFGGIYDQKYFLFANFEDQIMSNGYGSEWEYPWLVHVLAGAHFNAGAVRITPQFFMRTDQFSRLIRVSASANFKGMLFGLAYDYGDYTYATAGYELNERYRIQYAHGISTSRLGTRTANIHEFGIRTILFKDKAKRSFLPDVGLL